MVNRSLALIVKECCCGICSLPLSSRPLLLVSRLETASPRSLLTLSFFLFIVIEERWFLWKGFLRRLLIAPDSFQVQIILRGSDRPPEGPRSNLRLRSSCPPAVPSTAAE